MTLKDLAKTYSDREFMNIPVHCRPTKKFRDDSANELTKSILAYFKIKGWKAWRQNSGGRFIKGKDYTDVVGHRKQLPGMYIPQGKAGGKGSADVTCTVPPLGRRLEIEIKYGKDIQSDDQKEFQRDIEASGGIYLLVTTWDNFYEQINKYG